MDLLLDTHTFIWFINGDTQLPKNTLSLIEKIENKCYLSIASIWEIAIKISLGKLHLQSDFTSIHQFLVANDIQLLPLTFSHVEMLMKQDFHHRDPFDRILISQAIADGLTIVTKDAEFKHYAAKVIWH